MAEAPAITPPEGYFSQLSKPLSEQLGMKPEQPVIGACDINGSLGRARTYVKSYDPAEEQRRAKAVAKVQACAAGPFTCAATMVPDDLKLTGGEASLSVGPIGGGVQTDGTWAGTKGTWTGKNFTLKDWKDPKKLIDARVGGCFVRTKNPKVEGGPKANVQIGNVYGNVNLADGSYCEGLAFPPKFDVGVTGDVSSLPFSK